MLVVCLSSRNIPELHLDFGSLFNRHGDNEISGGMGSSIDLQSKFLNLFLKTVSMCDGIAYPNKACCQNLVHDEFKSIFIYSTILFASLQN